MRSLRAAPVAALMTGALVLLVTTGAVAAVSVGRAVGASPAIAGVPGLLGLVAVVELAARATARRRGDLALARLRGRHGAALLGFAVGPLGAATVVGVLAGLGAGLLVARSLTRRWGVTWGIGIADVAVALLVLVAAVATIAVVATRTVRRPLAESLQPVERRRPTPVGVRFLELVVVVAAAAAVYEAGRGGDQPVALLAPVLVGLAAGTVLGWLLELAVPPAGTSLGWFLATRRLRRDAGATSLLRVLVAAGVVVVIGLSAWQAAADWRDTAARVQNAGPIAYPVEQGALRAWAATRLADPDGRWLMAVVSVPDGRPTHRRVFVDTRRWDAVVGGFFAGTPVADVGPLLTRLATQPQAPLVRADRVTATLTRTTLGRSARLEVVLVDDDGVPETLDLPAGRAGTVGARPAHCRVGCTPVALTVIGARRTGTATLSRLDAGSTSLLDLGRPTDDVLGGADGLRILTGEEVPLLDFAGDHPPLALSAPGASASAYEGVDGTSTPAEQAGSPAAVPVFGTGGTLLDLPRALMGARGTVPSAEAVVVARADTPTAVTAALRRAGVAGPPTTLEGRMDRLARTTPARLAAGYGLVAGLVSLIALLHLLAWTAGRVGGRRAESAALRVAGHAPGRVARAYLLEAVLLGALVVVAVSATCWAATRVLLEPLHLHPAVQGAPALDLGSRSATVLAVGLGLAAATVAVVGPALAAGVRRAGPATLREVDR